MLTEINEAVERLLYEQGQIPREEVDVRFEAPTKDFVDSLTRPTISVFLCGVHENTELRHVDMQIARENGRGKIQLPPRRIELQYLVSVITTEIQDEHRLLWRTLATLMRYPYLPPDALPEALRDLNPPLISQVAQPEGGLQPAEIWNGLGMPPRPALVYSVTAPLDLEHVFDVPLVLTRTVRYGGTGATAVQESRHQVGGIVRSQDGQTVAGAVVTQDGRALPGSVTDEAGRFVLDGVLGGTVTLRAVAQDRPPATVTVTVPSETYDITLE